jgi:glycosyltransferase involved in cell wall biosynthesis
VSHNRESGSLLGETMAETAPTRILHVVGGMNVGGQNRGGVQSWLMNVLRRIDRDRFRFDFLVHTDQACADEDEIVALGGRIIPCPKSWNLLHYMARLKKIMAAREHSIVHSHVLHFSGCVLRQAARAGVPVRIAHSHNTDDRWSASIHGMTYRWLMRRWIRRYSTLRVACSVNAAGFLFGSHWKEDPHSRVLYCGVDLDQFRKSRGRRELLESVGIPFTSKVVGHVGRLDPQKNHDLLLEIAGLVTRVRPDTYFLLVGDGPLRGEIQARIESRGLGSRVKLLGARADVPDLMLGAFDLFVLPSHYEGLGLVLLEAQASGLHSLVSHPIPREVDVIPKLIHRISLEAPPSIWAEKLVALLGAERADSSDSLDAMKRSPFTIQASVQALEHTYGRQAATVH